MIQLNKDNIVITNNIIVSLGTALYAAEEPAFGYTIEGNTFTCEYVKHTQLINANTFWKRIKFCYNFLRGTLDVKHQFKIIHDTTSSGANL